MRFLSFILLETRSPSSPPQTRSLYSLGLPPMRTNWRFLVLALGFVPIAAYLLRPVPPRPCTKRLPTIVHLHEKLKEDYGSRYTSLYDYLDITLPTTKEHLKRRSLQMWAECQGPDRELGTSPYLCLDGGEKEFKLQVASSLANDKTLQYAEMLEDGLVECGIERLRIIYNCYKVLAYLRNEPFVT
ncbi:hypothetical protein DFJ77DRAFT_304796 [Powellomyces hirtus]|nr:hypothetical protein DFJ77DRAFT_304796 [Powellomyces hirtus]